jgi:hypothetical protein
MEKTEKKKCMESTKRQKVNMQNIMKLVKMPVIIKILYKYSNLRLSLILKLIILIGINYLTI